MVLSEADLVNISVIHATYTSIWKQIEKQGLSRMKRNHIHFTTRLPSEGQIILGMQHSCNAFIYVDALRAIRDGYTFYKSSNDVIICPGNAKGIIPSKYIKSIIICP
jgi:2'-phosphotransferase